jgi:hypothetical protein
MRRLVTHHLRNRSTIRRTDVQSVRPFPTQRASSRKTFHRDENHTAVESSSSRRPQDWEPATSAVLTRLAETLARDGGRTPDKVLLHRNIRLHIVIEGEQGAASPRPASGPKPPRRRRSFPGFDDVRRGPGGPARACGPAPRPAQTAPHESVISDAIGPQVGRVETDEMTRLVHRFKPLQVSRTAQPPSPALLCRGRAFALL